MATRNAEQVCQVPCSRIIELGEDMATLIAFKERVDEDLYNHGGPTGMKTMLTTFIAESRTERNTRKEEELRQSDAYNTRRRNKIAIASILVVALLPPVGWSTAQAVRFFRDLYQIVQEWHTTHQGEIERMKTIEGKDGEVYTVRINHSQELADKSIPRSAR